VSLRLVVATFCLFVPLFLAVPTASASDFIQQVVALTNAERTSHGLPALSVSSSLTISAQQYSALMATRGFFGHIGPDGSTLVTRDNAAGYAKWTYLAENLASGQRSPAEAVAAWLNSPEHRANLLSSRVREIGVGYFFLGGSTYGSYWVEELGNRSTLTSTSLTTPVSAIKSQPNVNPIASMSGPGTPSVLADSLAPTATDLSPIVSTQQLVQLVQQSMTDWASFVYTVDSRPDTIAVHLDDRPVASPFGDRYVTSPDLFDW
jgi:uncharacterized protein YkwD